MTNNWIKKNPLVYFYFDALEFYCTKELLHIRSSNVKYLCKCNTCLSKQIFNLESTNLEFCRG